MIGDYYWSTGITVAHHGRGEWSAEAPFFDSGFANRASSEGTVRARYAGPLSQVVDLVKGDAERLGIKWGAVPDSVPTIYYAGDGERNDMPPPPRDWRSLVNAEARRLGWKPCYKETP